MSLNLESGKRAATAKAAKNSGLYATARRRYGGNITAMKGDAPLGLLIGHVLRVNPALEDAPAIKRDRRRGFMKASINEARTVDIRDVQLDEPATCAFVYGREINRSASSLYTTYPSLFTRADRNLWKCAYLFVVLGAPIFNFIWQKANPIIKTTKEPVFVRSGRGGRGNWKIEEEVEKSSINTAYDDILYAVNSMTAAPPGWRLTEFRKLVLVDCEYVFELWRLYGPEKMVGFGTLPVLSYDQMRTIMNRVK
ncbi:MAG: hypothetical protein DRP83_00115 [Planctomycetota bacterium]|nr:MAG: hypothetical protein DRP83_00115 [Planctomycetota bacterium]